LDAIIRQYKKIAQYSEMLTVDRVLLGKKLSEITPGSFPKKVFYEVTGSGANEVAIKLARLYTGKQYIITQYGDYHGRTIGTSAFTHSFSTWAQHYPIPPHDTCVIRIPFPYCYRCPFGKSSHEECGEECFHLVEFMLSSSYYGVCDKSRRTCNIAAFLIEPFQSAAGYIIPPDNWIPKLHKIAKENDILFIVDEIQTGCGRTGKLWAVEHYPNVEPDIILVGKAIAGGLPFSVIVGRREIMDSWGPGAHSTTFAGYMLGVAAALATIEIFEREKPELESARKGEYFLKGLRSLMDRHPIIGEVQGKGLYIGIEFVRNRHTKEPATTETKWMTMRLLQLGMLVKCSGYYRNRFALSPPFTITYEQMDKAIEIFDTVLEEAEKNFSIPKNQ
ncbi:MAG: aspartate aminotransferase family protein, partial [Nitrososphaerota archaeon]